MYTSEDFGPIGSGRPRGRSRLTAVAIVVALLAAAALFRQPLVTRFRLWRLRSGAAGARASAWRALVDSGHAAEALERLDYAESSGFGTGGRFVPSERSEYPAVPRIGYIHVQGNSGEPREDWLYIKLLGADESIIRYIPMPPKMLIWGKADEDVTAPDPGGCNHISRIAPGREHIDIQFADTVRYAVEVNTANQVMRIRLRRDATGPGAARYHAKFTPLGSRATSQGLKGLIASMKLTLADATSPKPGDLATWVEYGSNDQTYFLTKGEASRSSAAARTRRLASSIDDANAKWLRSRGYAPMPKYRIDIVDAKEWPRVIREMAIIRDRQRIEEVADDPGLAPGAQYYVVKPGDVLSRIARRFGTTMEALIRANNLRNPDMLRVGQKLVIVKP